MNVLFYLSYLIDIYHLSMGIPQVLTPLSCLAGGEGFEPPLAESESAVLPLDDPPKDL